MKKRSNTPMDSPDRLNVIVDGSKVIGDMITESNLRVDGEVVGNVSSAAKVESVPLGTSKETLPVQKPTLKGELKGF